MDVFMSMFACYYITTDSACYYMCVSFKKWVKDPIRSKAIESKGLFGGFIWI